MISALMAPRVQTPLSALTAARPEKKPGLGGAVARGQARDAREAAPASKLQVKSASSMQREMATREINGLRERIRALKLLIGVDARAGLMEITQIAKELRKALKSYREASGGGAGLQAELAAMERKARAGEAEPAENSGPNESAGPTPEAEPETQSDADVDQGAITDKALMHEVKTMITGLRDAIDKVRARQMEPGGRKPDEDDWKEAREAMGELQADFGRISAELDRPVLDMKV